MRPRLSTPLPPAAPLVQKAEHKTAPPRGVFGHLLLLPGRHALVAALTAALVISTFPPVPAQAGDILRGGATSGAGNRQARDARPSPGTEAAQAAQVRAQDRLARTTQAVTAMRQMQAAARAAAGASTVPNGLRPGGLDPLTGPNAKWTGAKPARQAGNTVTIEQTTQQALLHWKTFNVGRETTVHFDQKAGGNDSGKWIAFNKVFDPSSQPSRILGSIKADGQVYVINQNGIIFGAGSQVNARTLVASSLPINDNLVERGLLNNRDAQFLFSGLSVPGGSDGTPEFTPPPPPPGGRYGDVVVERGASIQTTTSADGNGGRVILVGANVHNAGVVETPAGQTVLAAGLQAGFAAHPSNDPSLRGLDAWVGAVGTYGGTVTNTGMVEARTGSILITARTIRQSGILESSTSVDLNGRIDLNASFGAVSNPGFDNVGAGGAGGPIFVNQFTGLIEFGPGSLTRILPDYTSSKTIVGTTLPERSRVNMTGQVIDFQEGSTLFAPNAAVTALAGLWPYKDADGNRSTLDGAGALEPGLILFFAGSNQRFLRSGGLIGLRSGATIDVSGTTGVSVPLAQNLVDVEFRGAELADSPLQRTTGLRGTPLTLDLRRSGTYAGRYWIGTPLGDATGQSNLIQRTAAQLTVDGGSVDLQSGGAITLDPGSLVDVSGGFVNYEAGSIRTTRLLYQGRFVDIANATPDRIYDGVFTGTSATRGGKWRPSETFTLPLAPTGVRWEQAQVGGGKGGSLALRAAAVVARGTLRGETIVGPRQLDAPPTGSSLSLIFDAQYRRDISALDIRFLTDSPIAPDVLFSRQSQPGPASQFAGGDFQSLPFETLDRSDYLAWLRSEPSFSTVSLSPELLEEDGFSHLAVTSADGEAIFAPGSNVATLPGGSLKVEAAQISVLASIASRGGSLSFTSYAISPFLEQTFDLDNPAGAPSPSAVPGRGGFVLASGTVLDASGMVIDNRDAVNNLISQRRITSGGSISINAFSADLQPGTLLDVSGGVSVSPRSKVSYGRAGSISVLTGRDQTFRATAGGSLRLASELRGFSGAQGGSLTLQAMTFHVGSNPGHVGAVVLSPSFFSEGGFNTYTVRGVGGSPLAGASENEIPRAYVPTVAIEPGAIIAPAPESLFVRALTGDSNGILLGTRLLPEAQRNAVSLTFEALGYDDSFTQTTIESRGDLILGRGARLLAGVDGTVILKGQTVAVFGEVTAPGGTIQIQGSSSFPLTATQRLSATFARPTVHIAEGASLSTAGTSVSETDAFGRRTGTVYDGGTISISGNILAEAGSLLDVSGTSARLDFHPSDVTLNSTSRIPVTAGLNTTPWGVRSQTVRVESSAGTIDLSGSEMLLSDAQLLGRAGGPSAEGGTLRIFSGRFYPDSTTVRTSADINLVVKAAGAIIPNQRDPIGIGLPVAGLDGGPIGGMGYFSVDSFVRGGFDSLDLGAKFLEGATPFPFGGNVRFEGNVDISARGSLRVAGGGVIEATGQVSLSAPYIALGQPFRSPAHPDDNLIYFYRSPATPTQVHTFLPTPGAGSLSVAADLIDTGTLALERIRSATFSAKNGDIRTNGTLQMAGSLTLEAAQIYPTTLSSFDIFVYDTPTSRGRVSIVGSGRAAPPLSAGGSIGIYASTITQDGFLRAPFGQIVLGWDGVTDLDPSDDAVDGPTNRIAGSTASVPLSSSVTLGSGSVTSVSGTDWASGRGLLVPYGLSPDGLSWIDPRGVNVTLSGLPEKQVHVLGGRVNMASGATVDTRGGGDLYGFRWIPGAGGSTDITAGTPNDWSSGASYTAGEQVSYRGQVWSARVGNSGEAPSVGPFWSQVPRSFAILPSAGLRFAPFGNFNTGANSSELDGDPGLVDRSLRIGDQVRLEGIPNLPSGDYTLLPARYALLPGAFLVTESTSNAPGTQGLPIGSSITQGRRVNSLVAAGRSSPVVSRFEVSPFEVVRSRAEYADYTFNSFAVTAANRLQAETLQRLPRDGGGAVFQGTDGLSLAGSVVGTAAQGGRGGFADVATAAVLRIVGGQGGAPAGSPAVLSSSVLSSWNVESLLLGAIRRSGRDQISVRTNEIIIDSPGVALSAPDLAIASKERLTVTGGSIIRSSGGLNAPASRFTITGDGAAIRVSQDSTASLTRSAISGSPSVLMEIGPQAAISGAGVILDSTYGTRVSPTASIRAAALTLGSGQVSILFPGFSGMPTASSVTPHLVLSENLLSNVQQSESLTLRSYRTIDLYGSGSFGSSRLGRLAFEAAGIRGFAQGTGATTFRASSIEFSNPAAVAQGTAAPGSTAGLLFDADRVTFGSNAFQVSGYGKVSLSASGGVLGASRGSFQTDADLTLTTPVIVGNRGSNTVVRSAGHLELARGGGRPSLSPGLGASFEFVGASVFAGTDLLLPSGGLKLLATSGDVTMAGTADVSGSAQRFNDVIRYADAGSVSLESRLGNVRILSGALIDVSGGDAGGDAGTLEVRAPQGLFVEDGVITGAASAQSKSANFLLDAGSIASYGDLRDALTAGGFTNSQSFRLRSGSIVLDGTSRARSFTFAVDGGSLSVLGVVDASGSTGGRIVLSARDDVSVAAGALLTAAAEQFDSAGKGGTIRLEAGANIDGSVNSAARVSLAAGSTIDLSVAAMADFLPGDYTTPGSAAFYGRFSGTLHLRAPRLAGNDVGVDALAGSITGASSVLVEGYRLYDLTGSGTMNRALRDSINSHNTAYISAGEAGMRSRLLSGNPSPSALDPILVVAAGVEIVNRNGDLTLGLANPTGSTNAEARSTGDWDLSTWRYGARRAPGVLTLRAAGNVVFNNALSDGFTPVSATTANGNSGLWLATAQTINNDLPTNTQSWAYRLTAGADFAGADVATVLPLSTLDTVQPGKGSILVGEFYPAIPNASESGVSPGVGSAGLTSGTIRISTTTSDLGTRYEVVRTGTGSIDVSAGRDVQLRNQFASIYTAGVATPSRTTIFTPNDFVVPVIPTSAVRHPGQGTLGAVQQLTQPTWTLAGGSINISAGANIGRYTMFQGRVVEDSTRQLPNNWLYRRSYVDPATGRFANNGGVDSTSVQTITDPATSTTWWIDFSNFFQGIGTLGGGHIALAAGNDIVNVDAVLPTNARMPGRNPATGQTVAPDATRLVEWGGGDLSARAGRDLSGGIYYVQSGTGSLTAGREVTTNAARSPSLGYVGSTSLSPDIVASQTPATFDPSTWLPTTLFAGNARFDVKARGDILIGPAVDTFLLPQGLNNRFWYKTYFANSGRDASVSVSSFGGGVTHRFAVTLPGSASPTPVLSAWMSQQNVFAGAASLTSASYFQPWIRVVEQDTTPFDTVAGVNSPSLRSTAFAGSIRIVGSGSFRPSASGNLELIASDAITGLNRTGRSIINGQTSNVWTYATLNVSDADPNALPGISTPIAYQSFTGRNLGATLGSGVNALSSVNALFRETGSTTGVAATFEFQRALHSSEILHRNAATPVRLLATGGDITGFTLFSPKFARIHAERDLTDVALYIQNTAASQISIVSAGRDIIPFNESSAIRITAGDVAAQNTIRSNVQTTVAGTSTTALAGDIQISGPGLLEVLAGRSIDLGTGPNFVDGTAVGITSVANARNPFLPREGAGLVVLAGVSGKGGSGAALGLSQSSMMLTEFLDAYEAGIKDFASAYLSSLDGSPEFDDLNEEQKAVVALEYLYELLRQAGTEAADGGNYDSGFEAMETLFGTSARSGDIVTRSRDIRTVSGGSITVGAPGGALTLATDITGNPQTPPGIVTEFGGRIDILTQGDVDIGLARIFTLRGGDLTIWSSAGDIAAGNAPKTVVTAPPTRVLIDSNSAALQTDLGGLATGGGIGVLASVEGVEPGNVALIAPLGTVDAGDAGIRATGDISIAAVAVVNADNISAGGTSVGVPSTATASAPAVASVSAGPSSTAAVNAASDELASQSQQQATQGTELPSIITVEVLGYGGGDEEPERADDEQRRSSGNG